MVVLVMGVSGAGKTTVGRLLAAALGADFAEGDAFHAPESVDKMRRGVPLDDADRMPWLERLRDAIGTWLVGGRDVVLACSALKERYRQILAAGRPGVHFVYLRGAEDLIRARLELRRGHYMPPALLTSQFMALEEPQGAIVVEITGTPEEIVAQIRPGLARLGRVSPAPTEPA